MADEPGLEPAIALIEEAVLAVKNTLGSRTADVTAPNRLCVPKTKSERIDDEVLPNLIRVDDVMESPKLTE